MFAALKILRPVNLLFLAFALVGLLLFALQFATDIPDFRIQAVFVGLLIIYVTCSTMAAGYVINDLFDVETDKINKPEKTIVGTLLTIRQTTWIYALLNIEVLLFSVLIAWLTEKSFFIVIMVFSQVALFIYAKYLKRSLLWGNLLVAFLTAGPYLLFVYVFELNADILLLALYLALFAFLLNLIREITKDWEDILGDKAIRAKTFPILHGAIATRNLLLVSALISMFVHILVALIPVYEEQDLFYTVMRSLPVLIVAILHIPLILMLRSKKDEPKKISAFLKIMMLLGVLWSYYLLLVGIFKLL
jgi:4-hydroxybenzoate polyprenyltransferase